jgi:hypothetical protein
VQQQEGGKGHSGGRDDNKWIKRDDDSTAEDESRHKDRHHRRHRKSSSDGHKSDKRKEHKRSSGSKREDRDRDKKKRRHHRDDKREKKRREEEKEPSPSDISTSQLVSLGPITNKPPTEQLDPLLHYFSHNPHLRLYLYQTHHLHFEDLSSDSAREYFNEFVTKYNSGKLQEGYYEKTLPEEALDQCRSKTRTLWKFRVNGVEEEKLNLVKAGVKKQTEYNA